MLRIEFLRMGNKICRLFFDKNQQSSPLSTQKLVDIFVEECCVNDHIDVKFFLFL